MMKRRKSLDEILQETLENASLPTPKKVMRRIHRELDLGEQWDKRRWIFD